MIELYVYMLPF